MTPTATARGSAVSDGARRHEPWIDNLRVAVIVGVIGSHVSVIYALDIGWWYEERTASEIASAVLAGVFAPGLLFGMGLMFFIAGWSLLRPWNGKAHFASPSTGSGVSAFPRSSICSWSIRR